MKRHALETFVDDRIGVVSAYSNGRGHRELVCDCPFCGKKGRLYVNARTGMWTCYKCNRGGGGPRFVQLVDNVPFTQALDILQGKEPGQTVADIKAAIRNRTDRIPEAQEPEPTPEKKLVRELPSELIPIYDPISHEWRMPLYLQARGIRDRTAAAYRLGFCNKGRYARRILFPAHQMGALIFFQGRSTVGRDPKYLGPDWPKDGALYGFDEAAGAREVALAEGPISVLGAVQAGIPTVGLFGKTISPEQIRALLQGGFERVVVLLDPEALKAATKVAEALAPFIEADVARLPPGPDPGEAHPQVIRDAFAAASPPSLLDKIISKKYLHSA